MQISATADMELMRVDQRNLMGTSGAETRRAQESHAIGPDGRVGASGVRGNSAGDQVELSALSRALSSSATARSARVAELAAQYEAGQYHVYPAQVGRAMVVEALEVPQP